LVIITPAMEKLTGASISRVIANAGYRASNAPRPFQVYTTGRSIAAAQSIHASISVDSITNIPGRGKRKGQV